MHVPDGFIDTPVSAATGVFAAAAVAVALRGARRELAASAGSLAGAERTAPLAGLVAAFIFAVQMLNFPVAAGTSGHLLGGALAAILVGPCTGVLCVSVVLLMQGILFADGGLTALGTNITDMAIVTTVVAYALFRGLVKVLPRSRASVTVASFTAALVSVPAAACAFTAIYWAGGTTDVSIGKVATAMIGVHVLIGLGEAVITAATVGAVIAVRPDLVYGARGLVRPLELRTAPDGAPVVPARPRPAGTAAATPTGTPAATPARGVVPVPAPAALSVGSVAAPAPAAPAPAVSATAGTGAPSVVATRVTLPPPARPTRRVWIAGLGAALALAGGAGYYASSSPDGLMKVAQDQGIDPAAGNHAAAGSHAAKDAPLAGYTVHDVGNAHLSRGLAGAIGVGATLTVGSGLVLVVRRRRSAVASSPDSSAPSAVQGA